MKHYLCTNNGLFHVLLIRYNFEFYYMYFFALNFNWWFYFNYFNTIIKIDISWESLIANLKIFTN